MQNKDVLLVVFHDVDGWNRHRLCGAHPRAVLVYKDEKSFEIYKKSGDN
jgi:hypothetical protein